MAQAGTSFGVLDVSDAAIYAVTADVSGGISYGAKIDLPAMKRVSWQPNFATEQELKGDAGTVYDSFAKIESYTLEVEFQSIPLAALAQILGGTVEETTTASASSEVLEVDNGGTPGLVKIEALGSRAYDFSGGGTSAKLVVAKCRATAVQAIEWQEGGYATCRVTFKAYKPVATGTKTLTVGNYEAAQTLSA